MVGRKKKPSKASLKISPEDSEEVLTVAEKEEVDKAEDALRNEDWPLALQSFETLYQKHPGHELVLTLYWEVACNLCLWKNGLQEKIYDEMMKSIYNKMEHGAYLNLDCWTSIMTNMSSKELKILAETICHTSLFHANEVPVFQPIKSKQKISVPTTEGRPIIVGVISAGLRDHASGYLVRTWLTAKRDEKLIKIIAFSLRNDEQDRYGYRQEIIDGVDEFIDVTEHQNPADNRLSPEKLSNLIKSHEIDILVDIDGHSGGGRFDAIIKKPAPIIVNFIGQPGTTGSKTHDYIIVDNIIAPLPGSLQYLTENPAYVDRGSYFFGSQLMDYHHLRNNQDFQTTNGRMGVIHGSEPIPNLTCANIDDIWNMANESNGELSDNEEDSEEDEKKFKNVASITIDNKKYYDGRSLQFHQREKDANGKPKQLLPNEYVVTIRSFTNLPEGKIVIASFNTMLKTKKEMFVAWLKILDGVPEAVLWIINYPAEGVENMIQFVRDDPIYAHLADRIIPAPYCMDHEVHLRRIGLVTFGVDMLVVGGHTTTTDITTTDRPIVTCRGNTWCGKVSASILTQLKVPSLITNNLKDFVETAIFLAKNPNERLRLQKRIQENKLTSKLWNGDEVAKDLYRLFKIMFDRMVANEPPSPILPTELPKGQQLDQNMMTFWHQIGDLSSQGTLFRGEFRDQDVAIKEVSEPSDHWDRVFEEVNIHSKLEHPGILKLIAALGSGNAYLILERCHCNLEELGIPSHLTLADITRLTYQLLLALQYLDEQNVIHCDICPKTCLIDLIGNLKIANFENAAISLLRLKVHTPSFPKFHRTSGPPEVMTDHWFSFESDIYDAGATMSLLLESQQEIRDDVPQGFHQILDDMQAPLPVNRPNLNTLLQTETLLAECGCTFMNAFQPNPQANTILPIPNYPSYVPYQTLISTDQMKPEMKWFNYDSNLNFKKGNKVKLNFGFYRNQVGNIMSFDDDDHAIVKICMSTENSQTLTLPTYLMDKYEKS